ncbi:MAG: TrkA family potassium uptake protein [Elusimicrobiota bacterium]
MKKRQFAVIGMGTFGSHVATELSAKGAQVLAIDNNEEKVKDISALVTQAVVADATDEKTLRALGIKDMDVAIIAIGESMESSILIAVLLRELGVKTIIAKSINLLHAQILAKLGVDKVIYPEREMARKLAEGLISPNILEEIELSPEYNIIELLAPKKFWNNTIKESELRALYKVNVIALKRPTPIITDDGETDIKTEININPAAEDEIKENDVLVLVGKDSDLKQLKSVE